MRTTLLSSATALLLSTAVAASVPQPVSPGNPQRATGVRSGCPTFSWGAVDNAEAYEIVVYDWTNGEADKQASLRETVSGKALSWTPPAERCLAHGGRYGWSIRALDGRGEGDWSEVRLFVVAPSPSEEEVYQALEVLRRAGVGLRELERASSSANAGVIGEAEASTIQPSEPAAALPGEADLAIAADGTVFGNAFVFSCGEAATSDFFLDADEDTYGDPANSARACTAPAGYVGNSADCDDARADRNVECVCDPYNPTADCGPDATRCTPSAAGDGVCSTEPAGSGTQGSACASNSDCASEYVCAGLTPQCLRWCRVSLNQADCSVGSCFSTTPQSFIGAEEWGLCIDF